MIIIRIQCTKKRFAIPSFNIHIAQNELRRRQLAHNESQIPDSQIIKTSVTRFPYPSRHSHVHKGYVQREAKKERIKINKKAGVKASSQIRQQT